MNFQQSYREATVQGASPVQLVVRLHEQIIQDLRQAAIAIEQNDIGLRTKRIKHAILVIGHLQSPLDFANGGKVARDLDHFYDVLRQRLIHVQFHPSKPGVHQMITDLLAVREAWIEVERIENAPAAAGMVPSAAFTPESHLARADWEG